MTQPDIKALEEAVNFDGDWQSVEGYAHFRRLREAARAHLQSLKAGTLTVQALEGMKKPLRANYGYDDHGLGYDSGHNDAIDKVIGRVKND